MVDILHRVGIKASVDAVYKALTTRAGLAAWWTSNTVHPTVSSFIGAAIFGGLMGLGVGALVWAVARRTLVVPTR